MNSAMEPGIYVIAVSGGVDSMALLHMIRQQKQLQIVVAHLDHGIRADSAQDRMLVQQIAADYGLPFEYHEAHLGPNASEATARAARYDFLRQIQRTHKARAIITAHHQDDVLETAIMSLLRGRSRKGFTALASTDQLVRPLLDTPKLQINEYAKQHNLVWREDSTNQDTRYLRNYVRLRILPKFTAQDRQKLLEIVQHVRIKNAAIDTCIAEVFNAQANAIKRDWFVQLPHIVATEIMATWLRAHDLKLLERPLVERLTVAAKVAKPGTVHNIYGGMVMHAHDDNLALNHLDR